jgi:hypothetical protein
MASNASLARGVANLRQRTGTTCHLHGAVAVYPSDGVKYRDADPRPDAWRRMPIAGPTLGIRDAFPATPLPATATVT